MIKKKKFGISKQLSNSLSRTIQIANQNAGVFRFEIVPLSRIELDPENPRDLVLELKDLPEGPHVDDPQYIEKKRDKSNLESLAYTIQSQGIINPIWIYKYGENYRLAVGERRVLASILAGKSDIPAKILDKKPPIADLRLLQWVENMERSDLTLWERIYNIELIISEYKKHANSEEINASLIKQWLGCSLPQAMNYLSVINARSIIRDAIKNGSIQNLEKGALLANIKDEELFQQAFLLSKKGSSLKLLQKLVRDNKLKETGPTLHVKQVEQRGRRAKKINLGSTLKPNVVQSIVNSILSQSKYQKYNSFFHNIEWNNFQDIAKAFKQLIQALEKESD